MNSPALGRVVAGSGGQDARLGVPAAVSSPSAARVQCEGGRLATPPAASPPGGGPATPRKSEHRRRRSEEHTSELQSLMRISYAVFCLKKKKQTNKKINR